MTDRAPVLWIALAGLAVALLAVVVLAQERERLHRDLKALTLNVDAVRDELVDAAVERGLLAARDRVVCEWEMVPSDLAQTIRDHVSIWCERDKPCLIEWAMAIQHRNSMPDTRP